VEELGSFGPDEEDCEQDHEHLGHEGEQHVAGHAVEERPGRHHRGQRPAGHLLPPPQHHIRPGAAAEEVVQRSVGAEQPAALAGGAHRSTDLSSDGKGGGGTG